MNLQKGLFYRNLGCYYLLQNIETTKGNSDVYNITLIPVNDVNNIINRKLLIEEISELKIISEEEEKAASKTFLQNIGKEINRKKEQIQKLETEINVLKSFSNLVNDSEKPCT